MPEVRCLLKPWGEECMTPEWCEAHARCAVEDGWMRAPLARRRFLGWTAAIGAAIAANVPLARVLRADRRDFMALVVLPRCRGYAALNTMPLQLDDLENYHELSGKFTAKEPTMLLDVRHVGCVLGQPINERINPKPDSIYFPLAMNTGDMLSVHAPFRLSRA